MYYFLNTVNYEFCWQSRHCPGGQFVQFSFPPLTVLAVHSGRFLCCPLSVGDVCSDWGSEPRHGAHWYIPWESTGYPKVIIAASSIFVFFCSVDDFPGYLFSNGGQCAQSFLYFCFPHSDRILLIIREDLFFWKVNCNRAQPNGKGQLENKADQVFVFLNCVYCRLMLHGVCPWTTDSTISFQRLLQDHAKVFNGDKQMSSSRGNPCFFTPFLFHSQKDVHSSVWGTTIDCIYKGYNKLENRDLLGRINELQEKTGTFFPYIWDVIRFLRSF